MMPINAIPPILKLDLSGLPIEWVSWQTAAAIYVRDRVQWEAGEARFVLHGGQRADGAQSQLSINSIIAVRDKSRKWQRGASPPLSNRTLFGRDGHLCLYCGRRCNTRDLTRDHVVPVSRGGGDTYSNCVTCCRACNQRKDDRTPEEAGMPLLALPYQPDRARYLLLIASGRVTGCQQAFLEKLASRKDRQH